MYDDTGQALKRVCGRAGVPLLPFWTWPSNAQVTTRTRARALTIAAFWA